MGGVGEERLKSHWARGNFDKDSFPTWTVVLAFPWVSSLLVYLEDFIFASYDLMNQFLKIKSFPLVYIYSIDSVPLESPNTFINRDFVDVLKLKWDHTGWRWTLMTGMSIKLAERGEFVHRDKRQARGYVTMEAEFGVIHLQTKERQAFLIRISGEKPTLPTPSFQTCPARTAKEYVCCFRPSCV